MKINTSLKIMMSALFVLIVLSAFSQKVDYSKDVEPSRFDYGKMWTFEYAPLD